jgi:hypothetical protein
MKHTGFHLIAAIFTLALASGVATATGCGTSSVSTLCDDICACQRCTSNDLKACQDQGSATADAADAAGCSNQFADAVTCTSANVSCKNNQAVANGCDAQFAALTKCSSTLSVLGKDACQLAADKLSAQFAACPSPPVSTSTGSGTSAECTEAAGRIATCQAAAIAGVSCNCLGLGDATQCTADEQKTFTDALSLCH